MVDVEIICIGNELLIGRILNSNAQWLAKRVTSLGATVKRILIVGDDDDEIASSIIDSIKRKPKFILITGGLGPTFDDKTLIGVAKALNRNLVLNEKALHMIKERYAEVGELELTPHRMKMAMLPDGADPLPNPLGTAPGVYIKVNDTFIFALPGMPSEMEAIFESSIAELIKKITGCSIFYEATIHVEGVLESKLAPLIEAVMRDNPQVYVKSHPKGDLRKPNIEIHLSTVARSSSDAKSILGKAIIQLSELIKERGGKVKV